MRNSMKLEAQQRAKYFGVHPDRAAQPLGAQLLALVAGHLAAVLLLSLHIHFALHPLCFAPTQLENGWFGPWWQCESVGTSTTEASRTGSVLAGVSTTSNAAARTTITTTTATPHTQAPTHISGAIDRGHASQHESVPRTTVGSDQGPPVAPTAAQQGVDCHKQSPTTAHSEDALLQQQVLPCSWYETEVIPSSATHTGVCEPVWVYWGWA
eukprot:m.161915 g.161915  ORF g.161915 m.161915 type:complete len:211 (+) comp23853_c0_seq2:329-961(+)